MDHESVRSGARAFETGCGGDDLADVIELVRVAGLPLELEAELDPSVRVKWRELWQAAASAPPEE